MSCCSCLRVRTCSMCYLVVLEAEQLGYCRRVFPQINVSILGPLPTTLRCPHLRNKGFGPSLTPMLTLTLTLMVAVAGLKPGPPYI